MNYNRLSNPKGTAMITENNYSYGKQEEAKDKGTVRCSTCNRKMRVSSTWVEDNHKNILCEDCYQKLMFPDLDDSYERKIVRP